MPLFVSLANQLRMLAQVAPSLASLTASAAILLFRAQKKDDVFNILWVLVFGFATLNILSLVGRRFEPERRGWSFGESLAVLVVVASVVLLGWEMLSLFKIFPLKLGR